MRALSAVIAGLLLCLWSVPGAGQPSAPAPRPSDSGTVTGLVVDRANALPIAGAEVVAGAVDRPEQTTTTNASGRYSLVLRPAVYSITIRARGYQTVENTGVAVLPGTTNLDASLDISATTQNDSSPAVIGRVASSAHSLSAATTITRDVQIQDVTDIGRIRFSDQLGTLPAVNFSTSSSVGDDASINLRGLGTDESAALLDGHPVGPLGVGSGGFNFSLGPSYGLSEVDVTYGSGAQGLYGSDTIGGAVNFVTLNPTAVPRESFQQQIGGFGELSTAITASGTIGKLGYAFAGGRFGEYGDMYPGQVAQSARPNNVQPNSVNPPGICSGQNLPAGVFADVSACNLADNTYLVSQNTEQTVGLAKVDYGFSSATHFKIALYAATQWSDSTGNGDNDFLPYSTRLGQVQGGTPNCTTASGVAGYDVLTDPVAGTTACYTAQQLAAATSGPDGGGEARQRSTSMRDYDFSFTTRSGANNILVSAYANNYVYWKDSSLAGGQDATGAGLGTPTFADYYNTQGYLFSDELAFADDDVSFGYTLWHQLQDGNENDVSGVSPEIPTGYFGEGSLFVRDAHRFDDQLSLFFNAWVKRSSVTGQTTFDPRATVQYRVTPSDVVQLTYGHSDGAPSPQLKLQGAAQAADPGASLTTVSCNGYNDVTSAGNPALQSERANDFEAGYGHRFRQDSNIQVNAYVTSVGNQLFSASEPLTQYGINNVTFAPGALATYLNRLQSQCPGSGITMANIYNYLSVSTTYNAAQALARGLEFSGRQRFARIAYIDYGYDIESSIHTGIANQILSSNPTVVNGAQLAGIPLHQANISLDVAPGPYEFRIDNYYVGSNNPLNRPAYWHSDAFISRSLGHGTSLTLGGTNIFNQAVQTYGYIGYGTAPITNSVSGSAPAPTEEFGIAPAALTLTFSQKM